MFRAARSHHQEDQLYHHSLWYLHPLRLLTEGDDTRGCGDTIGPPDEQRAARIMLRSVM